MPFEPTQNLPPDPLVTVKFSGLLVIHPGADNTCDVGVHKFNSTHVFQVILVVSKPGEAPTLIPLLTGPLQDRFLVRLNPDLGAGDFKAFEKGDFTQTLRGSDPKDARWAINLQSSDSDIKVNQGGMPFVTLTTGVLFAPSLSDETLKPKLKRPPATRSMPLEHFAPELAVAIEPRAGTTVELAWENFGNPFKKTLPRNGATRYTVYFINEPPNLGSDPHDELALYYRILRRNGAVIPDTEQCELTFEIDHHERLDQIPCNPVTLNP